jgi:hypothetical protein
MAWDEVRACAPAALPGVRLAPPPEPTAHKLPATPTPQPRTHDPTDDLTARNFPAPKRPPAAARSLYAGPESSYRLAFTDTDFLLREELRPVRMQLELLKPELVQQEQGIESTIVIFGSARILPPEVAAQALAEARPATTRRHAPRRDRRGHEPLLRRGAALSPAW